MATVRRLTPMLLTSDMRKTIEFYTETLGFQLGDTYPEDGEPSHCNLASGDEQIMFYSDPSGAENREPSLTGELYLYPTDLDAYWTALKDHPSVVSKLKVQPWGMREFRIRDPNGYMLIFGLSADHHH